MAYYSNITYPYQQSDSSAAGGRGSISEELAAIKADIAYLYSYKMKTEDPVFTGDISGDSGTIPLLHGPVTLSGGDLSISCNLYANDIKANGSLNTENIVNLNNITVKPNSTLSINGSTSITNGSLTVPNERVTGQSVVNCLSVTDVECGIHNAGPYYLNNSTVQESGYTTVDDAIKNISAEMGDIDSIRVYPYCCPLFASCTKFPIVYGSNEDYTTNYQNIAIDKTQYYCVPENKLYLSNIQTGNINAIDTISSATLNVTGTVNSNVVSTGSVISTGNVSGSTGIFTNCISTPLIANGTALVLSGGTNLFTIDGPGACLLQGCICAPTLYGCNACVTDTANITNVNITGTANICTAVIDNIQLGYITINSSTGLSLVNGCTNGRVWLTDTAIGIGNASSAPTAQSVSIGTESYATDCNVAIGRYACSISDNGIAIGCGACTFSCCGWYILKHIRHGECGVSGEITMELKYPGGYPFRCDFYNALYAATKPGYDNILWFTGSELIIGGTDKSWKWSGLTEGYINSNNELMVHHLDDGTWHGFSSTCTACYPFEPWRPKIITLTYSLKACNPS